MLVCSLYLGWVIWLFEIWRKAKTSTPAAADASHITIIIPFRNEAQALPQLWNALLPQLQSTSGAHVIFIDDHSSDNSAQLIAGFQQNYPRITFTSQTTSHGKKSGVHIGVDLAQTAWVTALDADTLPHRNWLQQLAAYTFQSTDDLYILPLHIGPAQSFIGKLQEIEFLSVMGVTAAMAMAKHPVLCNGANLCFRKQAYLEVLPQRSDMHITSGDDLFLLQALKPRGGVRWIHDPETIVRTAPHLSWIDLLAQRLRWMGKTTRIADHALQNTARLTFAMNAIVVIGCIATLLYSKFLLWFLLLWLMKTIVDALLIFSVGRWMCIKQVKRFYLVLIFLYPFYATLFPIISMLYKPTWKGRTTHIRK